MKIIIILLAVMTFAIIPISAYPDSPKAQMDQGILAEDVICKNNMQLMIRNNGDAICVSMPTSIILEERGFAVMINGMKYMSHDEKYASEQLTVMSKVNDAIALYDEHGNNAFTMITEMAAEHDPNEPYVFVINYDDQRLVAHGFKPDQVGEISISLTMGSKSLEQLELDGTWTEYMYENPVTGLETYKRSWLVQHDGYIFGSGYFITEHDDKLIMVNNVMSDNMMSESNTLTGSITIGSIAPNTGGAAVYGQEISKASQLAIIHFNDYLQENNETWHLTTQRHDGGTSSDMALMELVTLNESGIKIIDGPALDYNPDVLKYANDNEMILVSCCSGTTPLAQNDNMFRIAPGHAGYAEKMAEIMNNDDIDIVIPIGVDNIWTNDILGMTEIIFSDLNEENMVTKRITYTDDLESAILELVNTIEQLESNENIGILYGGFEENVEFFNLANQYESLLNTRWYGTDLNTVQPNVVNDSVALEFAKNVQLTAIQPHVNNNEITQKIKEHFNDNVQLVRPPSVYTSYEYDVVWLIGLAILDAQSVEVSMVKESLGNVIQEYSGASGIVELDEYGDRSNGQYVSWKIINDMWVVSN